MARHQILHEGPIAYLKRLKAATIADAKRLKDTVIADAKAEIRDGVEKGVRSEFNKVEPKIKKGAKLFVAGTGAATLGGSYAGNKLANRKKRIKESEIMLFPFAVGIHTALAKARNSENRLVQEGFASKLAGLFAKKKPGSVLSTAKLGRAMYKNPKAMDQAFRLYGPDSKTIRNTIPTAFGRVR
jgi:hypothetical protein